jgi:hypothetical protein
MGRTGTERGETVGGLEVRGGGGSRGPRGLALSFTLPAEVCLALARSERCGSGCGRVGRSRSTSGLGLRDATARGRDSAISEVEALLRVLRRFRVHLPTLLSHALASHLAFFFLFTMTSLLPLTPCAALFVCTPLATTSSPPRLPTRPAPESSQRQSEINPPLRSSPPPTGCHPPTAAAYASPLFIRRPA